MLFVNSYITQMAAWISPRFAKVLTSIKSPSCERDGCMKRFSQFAVGKFLSLEKREGKRFVFMEQNAADCESVPIV